LQSSHIQLAAAMMSPVPETFAMDENLVQPVAAAEQEQLCYVHCNYCDTILAVRISLVSVCAPAVSDTAYCSVRPLMLCRVRMHSQVGVPCSSLFNTVAVRCGHCANLLSVNLRDHLLPAANQLLFGQALLSPTSSCGLFVRIIFR
jgi:hypothetical protein